MYKKITNIICMMKAFIMIGVAALFTAFKQNNLPQISETAFFNNFLTNTTQIDFYGNSSAYVYLNNDTKSSKFLNVGSKTNFLENLKQNNYTNEFLYKTPPIFLKRAIDYFFLAIFFTFVIYGRSFMNLGFSKHIKSNHKVSTKLKDVAGLEYNKKEIFEFVDFLKNRDKYLEIGARMPRGALLYGPPGTGKTLLAKAIAGECGISFISVSGSDFSQMYVGVGASRVRSLFDEARKKAPCIVFIDEIDALARSRTDQSISGGSVERDNTLNRLLVELDGFEDNDNILLFGATNRLDIIDKALLRPGRFDRKIRFELPEKNDRIKIFEYYLKKLNIDENIEELSFDLGKTSIGFSCADIANICNEASILSVRQEKTFVTKKLLYEAIDNVILGPKKETFRLKDHERKVVAYHEAGHTLISYFFENADMPVKVSIMPRGKSALGFSQSEGKDTKLYSRNELLDKMAVLLGGRIAEEIFCESITTGASDDIKKCTKIAFQYVCFFGMDKNVGLRHCDGKAQSEDLKQRIDISINSLIDNAYNRARKCMLKKKDLVEKLAKELLEKETIIREDLDIIWGAATTGVQ